MARRSPASRRRCAGSPRNAREGGGEDAQLRLESDRNLVQIVTVHKSKGLEYAVVFCPFLNDGALREPPSSGLPDAREYHDEAGDAVLHYGCDDEEAERASRYAAREQAAERARLVYVALTRAVYRCYLVGGVYLSSRSTKESRRSVLNWLVGGRRSRVSTTGLPSHPTKPRCPAVARAGGRPDFVAAVAVIERRVPLESRQDSAHGSQARTNRRSLRDQWRMASFSGLIAAGGESE